MSQIVLSVKRDCHMKEVQWGVLNAYNMLVRVGYVFVTFQEALFGRANMFLGNQVYLVSWHHAVNM
jgi:hypothetical protein